MMNRKECAKYIKKVLDSSSINNRAYVDSTDSDADYDRVLATVHNNPWIMGADLEVIKKETGMHVNSIYTDSGAIVFLFARKHSS